MEVKVIRQGDLLELRKAHPCGSSVWSVTRTGADIGMICRGCGHYVLISRRKLEPRIKSITPASAVEERGERHGV